MDLALFDFDGTITTRETLPDFLRFAVPKRRYLTGFAVLYPLIAAYRVGAVSGCTVRAVIARVAFSGADAAAVDRLGYAFAESVLPPLVRPDALARIDWHRGRGDTVAIVSGGFDVYLAPWAASHGLPVLASSLERQGARLTGCYAGPQCVGEQKVQRVRETYDLRRFDRVHAYGDSVEDDAMLAMAHLAHFRRMPLPGEFADTPVDRQLSGA